MSEQSDTEKLLADVAAETGGELVVEERDPSLGPIPLPHKGFRDGRCPTCDGVQFWHEYGDTYGRCAACGAQVEVPDDLV